MLFLERKIGESIIIDADIVVKGFGTTVRLGISAPPDVTVDRSEIALAKLRKKLAEGDQR